MAIAVFNRTGVVSANPVLALPTSEVFVAATINAEQLPAVDYSTASSVTASVDGQSATVSVVDSVNVSIEIPSGVTFGSGKVVSVLADGIEATGTLAISSAPAIENLFAIKLLGSSVTANGSNELTSAPNQGTDSGTTIIIPASSSNKPLLETDSNSRPVIRFSGLRYLDFSSTFPTAGDFTIAAVVNCAADSIIVGSSTQNIQIRAYRNGTNQSVFNGAESVAPSAHGIGLNNRVFLAWRRTGTTVQFFENNSSRGTATLGGNFNIGAIGLLGISGSPFDSSNFTLERLYFDPTTSFSDTQLTDLYNYTSSL